MVDGMKYEARLQYFHENPYLCDFDERLAKHFVPPVGPVVPIYGGGNMTLFAEPVVVLAIRGNCSFERKANITESIHESIKFLIVANINPHNSPDEEYTMIPMLSQSGNTRLVLLSISHATGQALKKFLSEQPAEISAIGGPAIRFDSISPSGVFTAEDFQSSLLTAVGLFFMLISFAGCLVILVGTYNQVAQQHGIDPIAAVMQRRLLTVEEVQQLTAVTASADVETSNPNAPPMQQRTPSAEIGLGGSGSNDDDADLDEPDEDQCAVCLGDFFESSVTTLPCRHKFHTSCITPWLTERQSKCPLCKFDVLLHIREQQHGEIETGEGSGSRAFSIWDRLRRYRWAVVHIDDWDPPRVAAASPNDSAEETRGVELTEQRPIL